MGTSYLLAGTEVSGERTRQIITSVDQRVHTTPTLKHDARRYPHTTRTHTCTHTVVTGTHTHTHTHTQHTRPVPVGVGVVISRTRVVVVPIDVPTRLRILQKHEKEKTALSVSPFTYGLPLYRGKLGDKRQIGFTFAEKSISVIRSFKYH